jgi:hypothetical protein
MRFQHNALGLLFGGLLSTIASPAVAQTAGVGRPYVWIHGHTGTIQEPVNTTQMYEGVNRIAVGLDVGAKRSAKVHKMEAVGNIQRGMPVTVQYEPDDNNVAGLTSVEATVTSVDRVRGRIGVKYDDGRIETLRVTEHSTPNSGTLDVKGRRVIVKSSNKSGEQVVQYFKRKS